MVKDLESEFYKLKRPDGSVGVHSSCKECIKIRERRRRARECISCKTTFFHTGSAGSRRRVCDYCSSIGRWCAKCEQLKPFAEFYGDGKRGNCYCRPCAKAVNRKRLYGVTPEQYAQFGNTCGACGSSDKELVVDHCHQTGEFRGLLCGPCNSGLGMFGDDINSLLGAITYLNRFARKAT